MYDPCTLYMNNVGWGRVVERQIIIVGVIFHINTNNVLFYVGIKYDFLLGPEEGVEMHIANTDVTFCDRSRITTIKL